MAGKFEEIDRLVSPKVNLRDIKVSILGIYSYVLLDKNEKKEAKKILLKAIKKGFTRKTLVRLIGMNKVEIFVEKLKPHPVCTDACLLYKAIKIVQCIVNMW